MDGFIDLIIAAGTCALVWVGMALVAAFVGG